MKISVASDHAGFDLKTQIADLLRSEGHEVIDFGTDSPESVDYPDFAEPAAREVAVGEADFGVLVCGSGVGVAIVANKVDGIRAVHAHDPEEAAMSRQHNNANVLTLGERTTTADSAAEIVKAFLSTGFEGGRHERRVEKIGHIEQHNPSTAGAVQQ